MLYRYSSFLKIRERGLANLDGWYLGQGAVLSNNAVIKRQSSLPRVTKLKSLSQIGQAHSSYKDPKFP